MVSQVFDGPIWIQAKRVIDYFRETIMSAYTIREPDRAGHRMVYNYPLAMFSELATNCILHKEYSRKEYIGIYVYKDHISFINHNRPVPPVTIEAMNNDTEFRDRVYLNPELKEMFFALDLIESYGSGIRRAKNAMKENSSPELVFEPANDTDDYTMVTAYINAEYARINAEERKETERQENRQENRQEISDKSLELENKIIEHLINNPKTTRNQLAEQLGIPIQKVKYRLEKIQKEGRIAHTGSTKSGEWVVLTEFT